MSLTDFVSDLGDEASWSAFKKAAAILSSIPLPLVADYTVSSSDNGMVYRSDSASPFVITVPANLPVGFTMGIIQWGTGTVTVSAGFGATLRGVGSASTRYAFTSIYVGKNDGTSAEFIVIGGA